MHNFLVTFILILDTEVGDSSALLKNADHGNGSSKADEHKIDQAGEKESRLEKVKAKKDDLETSEKDKLEKECHRDETTKFTGPYVFDALTGKIESEAPAVNLTDGTYSRVEFQLKRNFTVAETEPLLGNVFVIKGTVVINEVAVPFEIDWHVALNFRLTGDSAFKVEPDQSNGLLIDFDLTKWFDGIDLTQAVVNDDGTIYINKSSNRDIMHLLHKNIKTTAGFGKDANHDGKLQATEKKGHGEDTSDAEVD